VVWHHPRNSLRAFWKQQRGYGKAEALLERKWPEKYNPTGHMMWGGRLYGAGLLHAALPHRSRVYYGNWGTGLFQHLYRPADGTLRSAPLMPEWYLLLAGLAVLSALGALWRPLLLGLALLVLGVAMVMAQAVRGARRASFPTAANRCRRIALRTLTAGLYMAQPLARLAGRLRHGLTPWRRYAGGRTLLLRPRTIAIWSEEWRPLEEWVGVVEERLLRRGTPARRGAEHDRWELEARGGLFGRVRLRAAIEEHGAGRQLGRFRLLPAPSRLATALGSTAAALAAYVAAASAPAPAGALALLALLVAGRLLLELSTAAGALTGAVEADDPSPSSGDGDGRPRR
jgi:O-antigen biosynthesis protein